MIARPTRNRGLKSRKRRAEAALLEIADALGIRLQVCASENGRRLELHVSKKCRALGYQVIDDSRKQKPWDLRINSLRVQCKSRSRHGISGSVGVYLLKNSQKQYHVSDVDFFVVRFDRKCYVIPSLAIADQSGFVVRYVRLAEMRHYIGAWHQLTGERLAIDVQRSLFVRTDNYGR
jgi:hypothetical protein